MTNILVTGGAGFIGANFVQYWCKRYPDDSIIVLDSLTYAGRMENLEDVKDKITFVQGNICDQALVEQTLRQHNITRIVHFAAESHVDRSIDGPDIFIETNIIGTHSLLKAARKIWQQEQQLSNCLFHHVSTDEVFGSLGAEDPAFNENTAYAPNSPYSASKASSDFIVRAYYHTYGLPVITTNCSNNYGPLQYPEKLIPLMITNALRGLSLPVYGDGMNIRDWLHVEDHCRGIELAMQKGKLGETYAIGGHNEWANINIVKLLCQLVDDAFAQNPQLALHYPSCPASHGQKCESLITYVEDRAGHDRRYAIDASRAGAELGYTPKETFESGISKTLSWYLENQSWWQPLQKAA